MTSLHAALAEWSSVCHALCAGAVILTVRKGGIHERGGGVFAPLHQHFWLLPTFEHQRADRLRVPFHDHAIPGQRVIPGRCDVAQVWRVRDAALLQKLGNELPLSDAEVAARFHYRDEPLLFVLALRVWRSVPTAQIPDRPAYAGCRSWIELADAVSVTREEAVLDDATFATRLATIAAILGSDSSHESH